MRAEASSFFENRERLFQGAGAGRETASSPARGDGKLVFRRNAELKGPLSVFGYDYFTDRYGAEREASVRLLKFDGARGSGGDYAYEVLNLADGKRNAQDIRDIVSAVYGPIPMEVVVEYLRALESIEVVKAVP